MSLDASAAALAHEVLLFYFSNVLKYLEIVGALVFSSIEPCNNLIKVFFYMYKMPLGTDLQVSLFRSKVIPTILKG